MLPLIKKLEAVLKKGFSREVMSGSYKSVFKGRGMEFVGFREYVPSDDAMQIDWKASLRAHKSMVRLLEEERQLTVFFLLDVSDSMLFSSHKKLKCEYAAELVATLSFAMHEVGDNVGIAMFTDKIVKIIPPSIGKNQFFTIVKALSDPSLYGGNFDMSFGISYLLSAGFLRKDSVVFIVSDFIGMRPGWEESFKIAGLKYDLTIIIVRDPVDMRMPNIGAGIYLGDPYSSQRLLINPKEVKLGYEMATRNQITRLRRELEKTNSSLLLLETDKDFTSEIFNFFKMRQRFKR